MNFILLSVAVQLLFAFVIGGEVQDDRKRVVCYYAGLLSNQSRTLLPEDIDASLCTHLVYFQVDICDKTGDMVFVDTGNQFAGIEYLSRVLKLKGINPELKVLIFFRPMHGHSKITMTKSSRSNFLNRTVEFLTSNGFDGLEMEFVITLDPDKNFFGDLVCEMRAEFDKHGLILVTSGNNTDQEIEEINRCSDFINFRTIFYWSNSANVTGLFAPLTSVKSHIGALIANGFSAEKLLITIPTFGITFKLKNINETALGAEVSGPGNDEWEFQSPYTIMYCKLVEKMANSSEQWTIQRDEANNSPYGSNIDGMWVSYDDPLSAATKAQYILEKNLGGAAIMIMDMDDFLGIGGEGTFPLTRTLHNILVGGKKTNESHASVELA